MLISAIQIQRLPGYLFVQSHCIFCPSLCVTITSIHACAHYFNVHSDQSPDLCQKNAFYSTSLFITALVHVSCMIAISSLQDVSMEIWYQCIPFRQQENHERKRSSAGHRSLLRIIWIKTFPILDITAQK